MTLGISPRSSSAVLVAVRGPPESPRLLDRGRIELVGEGLPPQVYHAATALDPREAEELVERWAQAALDAATRGIGEALAGAATGLQVVGAGIVAQVRDVPPLAAVLRSHPLLHLAEGQLSREVLAEAAEAAGLPVYYLAPKGPHDPARAERAAAMRRDAGLPWRKEHKLAAVAALTALCAAAR